MATRHKSVASGVEVRTVRQQPSLYCLLCGNRTQFYTRFEGKFVIQTLDVIHDNQRPIVACGRCRSTSIVRDLAESPGWH